MSKSHEVPVYEQEKIQLQADLAAMIPKESLAVFNDDADQLGLDYVSALKLSVGDQAPLFQLPNAVNKIVALQDLLNEGPVVITFYRGNWCPYCNLVLNAYQRILPEIKALGANFMAISSQNPDSSLDMQTKHSLEFEVLSDSGNQVAKQFTTIIQNAVEAVDEAQKLGVDFYSFYDDQSREVPVPAVFILDKNGKVLFAKSEGGDYRLRVEPSEILNALKVTLNK
ncbi:peroxiredoxin-like family protein [Mucilaginibacter gotjawali]|uniref:thioredoxin-dependent peroxiredoxin n=2 Tax=Mucilaginibacter gotjawali TaxID=1550579 RepID=A0A110AZE0_9SPHI|nr:peroxiredoxin-like family protein [Mucilaginibacter gotjawali]MBB3054254.1 peroxiredoxin [Mucilaginibacter gotjawali]BAU51912.1 putative peroxiredoxin bcp [Mucilaginibacter gotjawali]